LKVAKTLLQIKMQLLLRLFPLYCITIGSQMLVDINSNLIYSN